MLVHDDSEKNLQGLTLELTQYVFPGHSELWLEVSRNWTRLLPFIVGYSGQESLPGLQSPSVLCRSL